MVDSRDITFWTDAAMAVCTCRRDKAVQEDGIGKGIGKRIFLIFAGLLIAWLPVLLPTIPDFIIMIFTGRCPR